MEILADWCIDIVVHPWSSSTMGASYFIHMIRYFCSQLTVSNQSTEGAEHRSSFLL